MVVLLELPDGVEHDLAPIGCPAKRNFSQSQRPGAARVVLSAVIGVASALAFPDTRELINASKYGVHLVLHRKSIISVNASNDISD
jgi:hypothetical protein